jgi:hypothetical protein
MREILIALAVASCHPASRSPPNEAGAPAAKSAARAATTATTAPPAASSSATPRPAPSWTANHALMLAIADGKLSFSSIVDPDAGVVFIDNSADPSDGKSGIKREPAGLRCGAALRALFDLWQKRLADKTTGLRATYDEERLACRRTPDLACVWRGAAEWAPTVHFLFRPDPSRGVALRAIDLEDELTVDPKVVARNRSEILPAVDRLERGGCPRP